MSRSPLLHVSLGLVVVLLAGLLGAISRIQMRHSDDPCTLYPVAGAYAPTQWKQPPPAPPGGRLIVKFRRNAPAPLVDALLELVGARVVESYPRLPGIELLAFSTDAGMRSALERYRRDPNVEYVEPDYTWHLDGAPSDARYSEQWGLENTGQPVNGRPGGASGVDIEAPAAWARTQGSDEVVVGVIDSGVDYGHEDLAANMWVNDREIPNNRIDDDKNGYVDDVHGMNAIDDSGDPMDDASHGTHVAGTIGAEGDNATGVAGVNWHVKIMALKFLSSFGGGTTSDAIKCVDYAVMMRERGVNLRVINCSWGGGERSRALQEAIERANDAGILFVCAAGNDATDSDRRPHFPSSYELDGVLSVAALAPDGSMAGFSNFGASSVDIAAPGVEILSTLPDNSYGFASGTSMAAPHVTGVAALVLADGPKLPIAKLRERILASAVPLQSFDGRIATGGRVSAAASLAR